MTPSQYKSARITIGLTQTALAAKLGVSRTTIQSRERQGATITQEAEYAMKWLHIIKAKKIDQGDQPKV